MEAVQSTDDTATLAAPFQGAVLACRADDVPDGEGRRVEQFGLDAAVAVFRVGHEFFALDDTCTHQDASLAAGWVEDCQVECPLHASCFDLRTGAVSGLPATRGVRAHRVEVVGGDVWVGVAPPDEVARSA